MIQIEKTINNVIKKVAGNIIGIGLSFSSNIKAIEKNKNIITCDLLNSYIDDAEEKGRIRYINIRKITKIYKKKRLII